MISTYKKSRVLQETCAPVCASPVKPAPANGGMSKKKECVSSVSQSAHRISDIVAETSVLAVPISFAEDAHDGYLQNVHENVGRVAERSADIEANDLEGEDCGASHTSSDLFYANGEWAAEISETQCEISGSGLPDISSALAKDMVNLYRNKVLPKISSCMLVSSSSYLYPAVHAPAAANSGIDSCKTSHTVTAMQVPISSTRQLKRTVAAEMTVVNQSPSKLSKTVTSQPRVCPDETVLLSVPKSWQVAAHFDTGAPDSPEERTRCSTLTSSCHLDTVPCATSASNNHVVSCLSCMPKNFSVQITQAVSDNSDAVSSANDSSVLSSASSFAHGENAVPNVNTFVSSKYKLIRRRESACKNTPRRASVKDADVNSCVPHRVVKHTPTLLVVNKYKLVRKRQRSLTVSVQKTPPDIKKTAPSMNLGPDILPPFCRNSLESTAKTRSSRYKLVRESHRPHSTTVKKPNKQSTSNRDVAFCGNHSLTVSVKKTPPDIKKAAPSMNFGPEVLPQFCRNSSDSTSKTRSDRYKLVRKSNQPHSTPVKKPMKRSSSNQTGLLCGNASVSSSRTRLSRYKLVRQSDQLHSTSVKKLNRVSALNQASDRVQVLSEYKLVRRKYTTILRTPHRATSTPANSSLDVPYYTRHLYNKHTTPPLFLNKYKLIRKRALLRTNSGCVKNSMLQPSHCLENISKPSVEGFQHTYSRKTHGKSLYRLPLKKRGTRHKSFLSKYALRRSGRGKQCFLFV